MKSSDFTKDVVDGLAVLASLHKTKFTDARLNDAKRRDSFLNSIRTFLLASALGLSSGDPDYVEKVDKAGKSKSPESAFSLGMAEALVAGYFQAINNDVASDKTADFGFSGLGVAFERATQMHLAEITADGSANKSLETGLNVKLRECSSQEYFEGTFWRDDIETLVELLGADIDDGYNKKIIKALESHEDVSSSVTTYLDDIKAVYNLLFADSFGIEQYRGVLIDGGKFLTIEQGSNEATPIREGSLTLSKFAARIYEKLNGKVTISNKRQFDYEEIFSSHGVVYFPRKILEYALGRESTINQQSNYYKNNANSLSWEGYSSSYVFDNVEKVLYRGVYCALEKVLQESKSLKGNFISQEFTTTHSDYNEFVRTVLGKPGVYDKVLKLLSRVVQSVKSAYILTKYPCLAGKIAAIGFRICAKPSLGGLTNEVASATYLFKNLVAVNENESFGAPVDITAGRQSDTGVNASSYIFEYQYDINPMLTKAEPLFGYTIQRLNQAKGRAAGWKNILIGQSLSGKELYASKNSDIKLQNYFTHNIIAGSRSGKGVMTMNILVNALAGGKPVFYLDRKPDMASMLFGLSGGSQFIINGGLYQPDNDPDNRYPEETGPAMATWRDKGRPYLEANPAIAELLGINPGSSPSYYSVLGDYVYFRAFMFCLGLCVLRTKLKGSTKEKIRDDIFGGDNGIVIVVDELTGFQSNIQSIFGNINSRMVQSALKVGDPKDVLVKRQEIEDKISVQEHKASEATKESQRVQAEAEISKLQRQLESLVDEQGIYAATLYSKICESFQVLRENKVAGFKNKEFSFSDIFVLGQELSAKFYTSSDKGSLSPVFFTVKADNSNFYTDYQGADIVRSFIEELGQEDWFLGRNPDFDYAKKASDQAVIQCLDIDGNWEYAGAHSCKQITGVIPDTFHHVLFKPYLVLNKHIENTPPTDVSGDGQYVAQCANRVNDNAGGANLWDTIRRKHMKPGVTATDAEPHYNSLDEGLGFMGLIGDTLKTTEDGRKAIAEKGIESYIIEVLGRSGAIANFVANAMGYDCWQDLIFDFSPKGLFGFNDMVNAVIYPDKYTLESRLPIHAMLGLLEDSGADAGADIPSDRMSFDDMFGDFGADSVDESSVGGAEHMNSDPFSPPAPAPATDADRPLDARSAAQQLWGSPPEETPPPPPPPASSQGETRSTNQQSSSFTNTDTLNALWSQALMLAQVAVMMDTSGYQYSDDDVNTVAQTAFELLKEFAGVN